MGHRLSSHGFQLKGLRPCASASAGATGDQDRRMQAREFSQRPWLDERPVVGDPRSLGGVAAVPYNRSFLKESEPKDQIFSNEGVQILPVKPNYGTKEYLCSSQGSNPVKIKHTSISGADVRPSRLLARVALLSCCWPSERDAQPLGADSRHDRPDSRHRQPAHPQGNHPCPHVYPSGRHLRSASRSSATSTRSGTRATSKICASSARTRRRASF